MVNCIKRISRINSAGVFFGGWFVCVMAVKHPRTKNVMKNCVRIVSLNRIGATANDKIATETCSVRRSDA